MIGDIVVDVSTSTYFIKTDTGWTSNVSEGLRKAIDASTLRLERNAGKPFVLAADVSRAHFRIHSKMADVNIHACYRSGTELKPGWSR